ncbi:MAG: hypothetical protein M0O96_10615 [Desulforhopalus sp.]|nr:hypothetical protein [Desulforhopalus sp.]
MACIVSRVIGDGCHFADCRHRVDKACLVSTTPLLKSLSCRSFTNDV